jgi:hypothetical protein
MSYKNVLLFVPCGTYCSIIFSKNENRRKIGDTKGLQDYCSNVPYIYNNNNNNNNIYIYTYSVYLAHIYTTIANRVICAGTLEQLRFLAKKWNKIFTNPVIPRV